VANGGFTRLRAGESVHYLAAEGETGPTAARVWQRPDPA
jgi:cold shock CspA family protein